VSIIDSGVNDADYDAGSRESLLVELVHPRHLMGRVEWGVVYRYRFGHTELRNNCSIGGIQGTVVQLGWPDVKDLL